MTDPSIEAAARSAVSLAAELDDLINKHLECRARNYVGRLGNLTEFLWENKVSILRALEAIPRIEAEALEKAATVVRDVLKQRLNRLGEMSGQKIQKRRPIEEVEYLTQRKMEVAEIADLLRRALIPATPAREPE